MKPSFFGISFVVIALLFGAVQLVAAGDPVSHRMIINETGGRSYTSRSFQCETQGVHIDVTFGSGLWMRFDDANVTFNCAGMAQFVDACLLPGKTHLQQYSIVIDTVWSQMSFYGRQIKNSIDADQNSVTVIVLMDETATYTDYMRRVAALTLPFVYTTKILASGVLLTDIPSMADQYAKAEKAIVQDPWFAKEVSYDSGVLWRTRGHVSTP